MSYHRSSYYNRGSDRDRYGSGGGADEGASARGAPAQWGQPSGTLLSNRSAGSLQPIGIAGGISGRGLFVPSAGGIAGTAVPAALLPPPPPPPVAATRAPLHTAWSSAPYALWGARRTTQPALAAASGRLLDPPRNRDTPWQKVGPVVREEAPPAPPSQPATAATGEGTATSTTAEPAASATKAATNAARASAPRSAAAAAPTTASAAVAAAPAQTAAGAQMATALVAEAQNVVVFGADGRQVLVSFPFGVVICWCTATETRTVLFRRDRVPRGTLPEANFVTCASRPVPFETIAASSAASSIASATASVVRGRGMVGAGGAAAGAAAIGASVLVPEAPRPVFVCASVVDGAVGLYLYDGGPRLTPPSVAAATAAAAAAAAATAPTPNTVQSATAAAATAAAAAAAAAAVATAAAAAAAGAADREAVKAVLDVSLPRPGFAAAPLAPIVLRLNASGTLLAAAGTAVDGAFAVAVVAIVPKLPPRALGGTAGAQAPAAPFPRPTAQVLLPWSCEYGEWDDLAWATDNPDAGRPWLLASLSRRRGTISVFGIRAPRLGTTTGGAFFPLLTRHATGIPATLRILAFPERRDDDVEATLAVVGERFVSVFGVFAGDAAAPGAAKRQRTEAVPTVTAPAGTTVPAVAAPSPAGRPVSSGGPTTTAMTSTTAAAPVLPSQVQSSLLADPPALLTFAPKPPAAVAAAAPAASPTTAASSSSSAPPWTLATLCGHGFVDFHDAGSTIDDAAVSYDATADGAPLLWTVHSGGVVRSFACDPAAGTLDEGRRLTLRRRALLPTPSPTPGGSNAAAAPTGIMRIAVRPNAGALAIVVEDQGMIVRTV